MILQPDDKLFEELYYLLFTSRGDSENHNFSCTVMTAILAYYFSKHTEKVWILDTTRHCVLYDTISTWDFNLGIVFENYKYPNPVPPPYHKIPKFYKFFDQNNYEFYYSDPSKVKVIAKRVLFND
tara:strand:- start:1566 stop:1940 length:375 start_codon:yes stop_codon:yes gene_type:complete